MPKADKNNKFTEAIGHESPLQVVGAINAYHAILAKASGFRAIYLSGGGVSAPSLGIPDLGISTLEDVLTDVRRITDVCDLPLLVDIDTGFGSSAFNISRTIKSLIKFGASAAHIEDQVSAKRCGHRPGKELVSADEMCDRIKAATDARTDSLFSIMARTDSLANEELVKAIERCHKYVEAGADMLFPEAITDLKMYKTITNELDVPVLANITEFGKTPLFSTEDLKNVGVRIVLYPLSAFRSMNNAALKTYECIKTKGSQKDVLEIMQTREELYRYLDYHTYEKKIDELFKKN